MAIMNPSLSKKKGFALLIAVIFMSVMLTFGLALSSIGFKQQQLASSAIGSHYAFYAADAGLECALFADQQYNLFAYSASATVAPRMTCDGVLALSGSIVSQDATRWAIANRVSLDNNTRCADVTVYKLNPTVTGTVYLFSQGYDAPCSLVDNPAGVRLVSRGVQVKYSSSP
jgi:hypothetical protein